MNFTIDKQLIPGIPQQPYRNGVGAYEGVVDHCTDSLDHTGGDTAQAERDFEAKTWQNAFVHFFVGARTESGKAVADIIQVADTEYIAWGAGPNANPRFVHIELCMYDDPALFKAAYDAYVWLTAKVLHDRGLGVNPAQADGTGTLWAHNDVSRYLGGTDHTDPISYLQAHLITWQKHVANVQAAYDEMGNATANTGGGSGAVLKQGDSGEQVTKLQTELKAVLKLGTAFAIDGQYGPQTAAAVKEFQLRYLGAAKVTGTADDGTMSYLETEYKKLEAPKPTQTTPATASVPTTATAETPAQPVATQPAAEKEKLQEALDHVQKAADILKSL